MYTGRNTNKLDNLSTAEINAHDSIGEHAIDRWEGEGGGPTDSMDAGDLAQGALADNAGWRASNNVGWRANHPPSRGRKDDGALATALALADSDDEEDQILRCLGAAVITRWNTIPTKLQRELFDNAISMEDLLQTDLLKGQIARFLRKQKDDAV